VLTAPFVYPMAVASEFFIRNQRGVYGDTIHVGGVFS
jgi:hypothetical protein